MCTKIAIVKCESSLRLVRGVLISALVEGPKAPFASKLLGDGYEARARTRFGYDDTRARLYFQGV